MKRALRSIALSAGLCLAMGAGQASAATFVVNQTVDLTGVSVPADVTWQLNPGRWSPEQDLTMTAGDVLDWTVHFVGGHGYLYTTGPFDLSVRLTTGGDFVILHTTATIDLLDAGDSVFASGFTESRFSNGVGSNFYSTDFSGLGLGDKIFGFHYVGTVDDLQYQSEELPFRYGVAYVTGATPVPEPTTWVMMILGFGMVGAALRRRLQAPA